MDAHARGRERPIRVLVVDDSAFMRHTLGRLLGESEGLEVVGSAADGEQGLRAAATLRPDVITLDVEMPVLDGLAMLRRLMDEAPTRVVMVSSLTAEGARVTLDALEAGAVDFIAKPSGSLSIDMARVRDDLVARIRAAAAIPEAAFLAHRLSARSARSARGTPPGGTITGGPGTRDGQRGRAGEEPALARLVRPPVGSEEAVPGARAVPRTSIPRPLVAAAGAAVQASRLVVIASSTGGPNALHVLAHGLPLRLGAAVLVVQHMPPHFTASLAQRLDAVCPLPVTEAAPGDVLAEDRILLAPGGVHTVPSPRGRIQLAALPPVNGLRPAADVTLQALAPSWRDRMLLVVLTGMGSDARDGGQSVRAHGGTIYAQDAASSVVFGMPGSIVAAGLADRVLPLDRMADAIADWAARG